MKFSTAQVIITDDEGFMVLKGILPKGSIVWSRTIDSKVAILLQEDINIEYLEKQLNSLHRNLSL